MDLDLGKAKSASKIVCCATVLRSASLKATRGRCDGAGDSGVGGGSVMALCRCWSVRSRRTGHVADVDVVVVSGVLNQCCCVDRCCGDW